MSGRNAADSGTRQVCDRDFQLWRQWGLLVSACAYLHLERPFISSTRRFGAGCIVQISFFAFLAIQSKQKAPRAHTLLEIIRTRYGKAAHIVYMGLCLIDNIISVANMLLGASAVV